MVPPGIDQVQMFCKGDTRLGEDYDFETVDQDFSRITASRMGYFIREVPIRLRESCTSALVGAGFSDPVVKGAISRVLADFDRQSDFQFMLSVLGSDYRLLAGESRLEEALRTVFLQAVTTPEWAAEFRADGRRAVAFKVRKSIHKDVSVFYSEFDDTGRALVGGLICLPGSPSPQEIIDRIITNLGRVNSLASTALPKGQ